MMPPSLLLLGIGRFQRWPIPLPLFLLWPLLALAYLVLAAAQPIASMFGRSSTGIHAAFNALEAYRQLGGLSVNMNNEGRALEIRII